MKKLILFIFCIVMVVYSFATTAATPTTISNVSLTEITPVTITATSTTELKLYYPKDAGLLLITSSATGTVLFHAGQYSGATSMTLTCAATKTYFMKPVESSKFLKFDGYIYITVTQLTGAKLYFYFWK